jgi:hypothetical protein
MKKDENINISIGQMVALIILVTLFLIYSSGPFFIAETSPFYRYFTGPYRVILVLFFLDVELPPIKNLEFHQKRKEPNRSKNL